MLDESKGYLVESRLGQLARDHGCASYRELCQRARATGDRALAAEDHRRHHHAGNALLPRQQPLRRPAEQDPAGPDRRLRAQRAQATAVLVGGLQHGPGAVQPGDDPPRDDPQLRRLERLHPGNRHFRCGHRPGQPRLVCRPRNRSRHAGVAVAEVLPVAAGRLAGQGRDARRWSPSSAAISCSRSPRWARST